MPKERVLLPETLMDSSIETIFSMVKCDRPDQLKDYARQVGVAPIRKIYQWANEHRKAGLSADIAWKRGREELSSLLIQVPELDHLCQVIDETSDTEEKRFKVLGVLSGIDVDKRDFFHFKPAAGDDIEGKLADTFQAGGEVPVNKHYKAEILKTTKTYYSTEKEEVHYYLISLE